MRTITIQTVAPYIDSFVPEPVVVVGVGADTRARAVKIPIPLYETGCPADFQKWINEDNERFDRENDVQLKAEQRQKEIGILRELMQRYPEELSNV